VSLAIIAELSPPQLPRGRRPSAGSVADVVEDEHAADAANSIASTTPERIPWDFDIVDL
jgi:hypothetical protein